MYFKVPAYALPRYYTAFDGERVLITEAAAKEEFQLRTGIQAQRMPDC